MSLGLHHMLLWPSKTSIKVDSCWCLSSSLFFAAHTLLISYHSANCSYCFAVLLALNAVTAVSSGLESAYIFHTERSI